MYRKRPIRDQEIEDIIDGEIMEWDLQEFGWESSTDLDPRDDHEYDHQLASDHHLLVLDFTNSPSAQEKSTSQSSEPNSRLITSPTKAHEPINLAGAAQKRVFNSSLSSQKMSCSVDGCNADLSGCREYHRRHRVCERHSKTPVVTVNGEEKRFCQQCSRFHSLGEFDEVKRSCRKRLDGHNRRRRKSQPEPLYFSSKNFLSGFKGPRILHFGNPQIYATASVRTVWPVETKTGSESWLYGPHHRRLQVTNQPSPAEISFNGTTLKKNINLKAEFGYQTNSSQQLAGHPFEAIARGMNDNQAICDEEVSLPIDSGGRALYLLSTNPTPQSLVHQPSEGCSFQLVDFNQNHKLDKPPLDPLINTPNHNYSFDNNGDHVYATNMMLRMGPDSLLEHGTLQMLPISLD